ncbi:homoserine O-acetyltransferase MetX [Halococcoides cellulosivorans]|uniref:Homoserine O-acetyltransferase n=1 Tax=Halococcoides cellulosivorans TaxID=1679096 RepID=A0A2R4X0T4_9EURY|nr:homoserine O-acetyltransferase [Halococcoides cellulosivorans]AWB27408.1 homoserine O-acetyltransferase [Halococcoides cellulosivorans]
MNVERETVSVGEFEFACGESIPDLEVAYEAYGEFTGDNAVLLCHALTGSAHVASHREADDATAGQARAWWDDIVGPGKAIDTNDFYVVCANVPGSCYGTTGPASENPETGAPYGPDFPPVSVADWTEAQRRLLDELGVPHLHAIVGGSVGGMNVLEWAKRHPDHVDRIVPIATAARLDTQSLALHGIKRRAVLADPAYRGGEYYDREDRPTEGLAVARQIGHVMYLSKASMDRKFGRRSAGRDAQRTFPADPTAQYFPYRDVESYLDYQAETFVGRFDPNSFIYLTRATENYDLSAGFESDEDALGAFDGEALVMSFTGDWHFPVEQGEALADALRAAGAETAHHVIESDHGHDAFLVEPENVGPPLADFLAEGPEGSAITDTVEQSRDYAPVHNSLFGT